MSDAKQKVFMIRADSAQHNRLKVLAARMDIGMSDLIREAVDAILAKHEANFERHASAEREHDER
jgi:predicted transcriptional regulator